MGLTYNLKSARAKEPERTEDKLPIAEAIEPPPVAITPAPVPESAPAEEPPLPSNAVKPVSSREPLVPPVVMPRAPDPAQGPEPIHSAGPTADASVETGAPDAGSPPPRSPARRADSTLTLTPLRPGTPARRQPSQPFVPPPPVTEYQGDRRRRPVMSPWQASSLDTTDAVPEEIPEPAPPQEIEPEFRTVAVYSMPALLLGIACMAGGIVFIDGKMAETGLAYMGLSPMLSLFANTVIGVLFCAIGMATFLAARSMRLVSLNDARESGRVRVRVGEMGLHEWLGALLNWSASFFLAAAAVLLAVIFVECAPRLAAIFIGTPALVGSHLILRAITRGRRLR